MDRTEVYAKVLDIVDRQFPDRKDVLNEETDLVKDLGADSLDAVEVVMEIEDIFDMQVSDQEAQEIKTVRHIVDLIMMKMDLQG